eukprot:1179769-Prorocentrum_minimum.AAC.3
MRLIAPEVSCALMATLGELESPTRFLGFRVSGCGGRHGSTMGVRACHKHEVEVIVEEHKLTTTEVGLVRNRYRTSEDGSPVSREPQSIHKRSGGSANLKRIQPSGSTHTLQGSCVAVAPRIALKCESTLPENSQPAALDIVERR